MLLRVPVLTQLPTSLLGACAADPRKSQRCVWRMQLPARDQANQSSAVLEHSLLQAATCPLPHTDPYALLHTGSLHPPFRDQHATVVACCPHLYPSLLPDSVTAVCVRLPAAGKFCHDPDPPDQGHCVCGRNM